MPKTSNKTTIKVEKDFIDSLIFSSCRYYIGRKSIQAAYAPADIVNFLKTNNKDYKLMSQDRLRFFAKDIREEINRLVGWCDHIQVDGHQNEGCPDALTLLVEGIVNHINKYNLQFTTESRLGDGSFNPDDHNWTINLQTREVEFEMFPERKREPITKIRDLIMDLDNWVKLAGWLDPTEVIGHKEAEAGLSGFAWPSIYCYEPGVQNIALRHIDVIKYAENPIRGVYYDPEQITVRKLVGPSDILVK